MKLTEKQKEFMDAVKEFINNFGSSCVPVKYLEEAMKEKGLRIPRQIMNPFIEGKGRKKVYNLSSAFEEKKTTGLNKFATQDEQTEDDLYDSTSLKQRHQDRKLKQSEAKKNPSKKEKDLSYNNPVYVVIGIDSSGQENFRSVSQSFKISWEKRKEVLHDNGIVKEEEAQKELNKSGFVYIQSSMSTKLFCKIIKTELLP